MTEDFMKWAGLDDARWNFLQDKLRRLVETERTPARVIMALMNDNSIGYREQCVLTYWLGRQQGILAHETPVVVNGRYQMAGMN
jgi:hypothetical protein